MEAKLIVVGGKANKVEVNLTLPAVIGRGRDANLTVAHSTVSRRHCLLYEKDGALIVRDNGSLNGTVIEGERITEAVLRPGDTLTVGPLTFRAEYEHFGVFPDLSGNPTLPNVHDTVDDKQAAQVAATRHEEVNAGNKLALSLPDLDPPAAEEAASFGFLSEPVENSASPSDAIADQEVANDSQDDSAEAPHAEAPADSGENAGLDFLGDDDHARMAAKDDSPSFGFLGDMDEPTDSNPPDSQLPELTLHDSEEPSAAAEDSGDYALSVEPAAPSPNIRGSEKSAANEVNAEVKNGKHRGAADDLPAVSPVAAAPIKAPSAEAARPVVDMDAAALDFLSDESSEPGAAKGSKAAGKPAQGADSGPEINVGPDRPKAAAPEDDELNNFFDSIGLK